MPGWINEENIIQVLDVRDKINRGESPMAMILSEAKQLQNSSILKLITPFFPAPIIDQLNEKGYQTWSNKTGTTSFENYIIKKN